MTHASFSLAMPVLLGLLAACHGSGETTKDSALPQPGDSVPEDTGEAPAAYDEAQVCDISWALHEEFESLVIVSWEQLADAEGYVEFSVDEGIWRSSPSLALAAGPQQQLLLGLPYDAELSFRVVNDFGDGPLATAETAAQTGALPDGAPVMTILTSDDTAWEPSLQYVLACMDSQSSGTFVLDRQGGLVWARKTPAQATTLYARPSYDGRDILIDHNSYWAIYDGGAASQVVRMKIDGSVLDTYDTPGLHHAFTELPDGSIVWGAAESWSETIEKLTPEGLQQSLWSCDEWHKTVGISSYCQSNTLYYHEPDDSFLFSLYSAETVIEIDHATGASLRWFGHAEGSWAFEPGSAPFYWQHGAHYTEQGNLLLSSHVDESSDELVVREYALDEDSQILSEVWNFGVGLGVEAGEMGEVHRLPNGNTLHNYGTGRRLREVTPDGTVVWDVSWEGPGGLGSTIPVQDLYDFAP